MRLTSSVSAIVAFASRVQGPGGEPASVAFPAGSPEGDLVGLDREFFALDPADSLFEGFVDKGFHPAAFLANDVMVMFTGRIYLFVARGVHAQVDAMNQALVFEALDHAVDGRAAD